MTTNDTSRPSVKATTAPVDTAEAGSPATRRESWLGTDWPAYTRTELGFRLWAIKVRLKHLIGIHTWIPTERWVFSEGEVKILLIGEDCWLCPARRR